MSLTEFDSLRASHPQHENEIAGLEAIIREILSKDPLAIIDDNFIAQRLKGDLPLIHSLLVELVSRDALSTCFFWICPNGYGTAFESKDLEKFPDVIECDRCGQEHFFSQSSVEVNFLPSESLKRSLHVNDPR